MSRQKLKGTIQNVSCLSEELVKMSGLFRLEHSPGNNGDNPKFFTRVYRLILDGNPTQTTIKFTYDYRDNSATVSSSRQSIEGLQGALAAINRGKE